jgi:hypothetical protein
MKMEMQFVERFKQAAPEIRAAFHAKAPTDYKSLVRVVVEAVSDHDKYNDIDPDRIHEIDDGDYQGTLIYIIAAKGYQPRDYWSVRVGYGSYSGCDTLKAIGCYGEGAPSDSQLDDYMTLALHVVQNLKPLGGDVA